MNIAILGFDRQGRSAYDYLNDGTNSLTVCDRNPAVELPEGATAQLGDDYLKDLGRFDRIYRTPGLHPRDIAAANPQTPDILEKVTTNTNEFIRICPTQNVIGVTGTKGKGTTSTLIARMLEAAGHRVHLGGNIGIPPLEMLKDGIQPDDWVVLELANFQLIDLKYSPHIAVCLMVEPEHLDWHADMQEYIRAKSQLFRWQTEQDIAIHYAFNENSSQIALASPGAKIPYMQAPGAEVIDGTVVIDQQEICTTDEIRLLGQHNWQNICAAVTAVWQITKDTQAMRQVATTFSGLPFRIEFRREVDGVSYYNDSFATGPGACIASMRSIPAPKVMIIGGYDRGLDLSELAEALLEHAGSIRKVLLIGASAERTSEVLQQHNFEAFQLSTATDMPGIVEEARSLASPGDAVVLSPSFASFDMFKNFEDRGIQYNAAVENL